MNKHLSVNLNKLIEALHQQKIIAYPTESIFGLGCDPDSKSAVQTILTLKKRSRKKGLILVAAYYEQLSKYIYDTTLNNKQRTKIFSSWPGPFTWVFPAQNTTPKWLTGNFSSLAVRISSFEPIRRLCIAFGKPLVSTSANFSGQTPARSIREVVQKFGKNILIMNENVEGHLKPSEIRDAITNKIIR